MIREIGQYNQERQPVEELPEVLMVFFCQILGDAQEYKEGNDNTYSCHIEFRSP